ncbi:MAG: flagellar protein FlgN [Bacillota bacterium]
MEALVNVLQEQLNEYKALLDIAAKKKQVLIGNDIKELDNLNKKEQEIIIRATRLENKRLQIIHTLSGYFSASVESITLKDLAETAPQPFKSQLTPIYQELQKVIEELSQTNQENSSLIEQALKIVNFTINTIASSEREVVYPEKDSKGVKQLSRIFDSKA